MTNLFVVYVVLVVQGQVDLELQVVILVEQVVLVLVGPEEQGWLEVLVVLDLPYLFMLCVLANIHYVYILSLLFCFA